MPFQSQAQRGYMFVHHPEIAKRFAEETPKGKKFPEHVASHNEKAESKKHEKAEMKRVKRYPKEQQGKALSRIEMLEKEGKK